MNAFSPARYLGLRLKSCHWKPHFAHLSAHLTDGINLELVSYGSPAVRRQ